MAIRVEPNPLKAAYAILLENGLDGAGIDAIEVSGGTPVSGERSSVRQKIDSPEKEGYHLDLAVARGIDYVSLARPLVRKPALINRWRAGDRRPAT